MERREGRRGGAGAGSAPRRPRSNGPKDASDEDERMDDAPDSRLWERPKKERSSLSTFQVSVSANPRNKRKRQGLQEAQAQGRSSVCDDADESTEETEIAASEDDDEPPPPPILRRPGKSRGNGKLEDEIVMEIPTVPRKARSAMSSSCRFSSILRRPQESPPVDTPRQQSPVPVQASLNGISSPNLLGKPGRRPKPSGTKIRAIKVPKVSEATTISDQEVEVAEALFVLARSMPSHAGVSESKFEQKPEAKLEAEVVVTTASPPRMPSPSLSPVALPSTSLPTPSTVPIPCSTVNGYPPSQVQNVVLPSAEAPKRKRPRVVARQEEVRAATPMRMVAPGGGSHSTSPPRVMHSPSGEAELATIPERSQPVTDDTLGQQAESLKGKGSSASPHLPQLHATEEANLNGAEDKSIGQTEVRSPEEKKENNPDPVEWKSGCSNSTASSPANIKAEASVDVSMTNDGLTKLELLSRPEFPPDNDTGPSKLRIDLMAPPLKMSLKEEVADVPAAKNSLQEDPFVNLASFSAEAPHVRVEKSFEGHRESTRDEETDRLKEEKADEESEKAKERDKGVDQEQEQEEKRSCKMQREGPKEGEREEEREPARNLVPVPTKIQKTDTGLHKPADKSGTSMASSFLPSTLSTAVSSSAPVALAGWMSGLPPLGYYGSGAPPWPAAASLPGPANIDGKTAHPAVQLPHAAVLQPLPKMKRCATHVYVARLIYLEQQRSRHTMWPATLCRGAPYNLNIPPVNAHEKEKIAGTYVDLTRKVPSQQAGPAYGFTVSQSNGPGVAGNSGTLGSTASGNAMSAPTNSAIVGVSVEAGAGTASGTVVNMAAHAQYIQAMMQQNGFTSFSFPFNGPPGQAAQFFNGPPFYPAHLVPPLPHLQPLAQQASNMLPSQKQQQGLRTLPQSSSSQLLPPPPQQQQQQQLQLQLAPQSPSNSQQQQHHMGTSTQHFGAHSEKDSNAGGESHSTAESRLSAMQRSMCGQGPSNLPNPNLSPSSSLMLTASIPALPLHPQDFSLMATLGGKQNSKSQQQQPMGHFQSQQLPALSPPMQQQQQQQQQQLIQQHSGAGPGLQMKGLDPSVSQAYSQMSMPNMNRGSVGPGPLGFASVASVMAPQGHAMLQGATETVRAHAQQQQGFAGHNQQYHQRTMPRATTSVNEDGYVPNNNRGRDSAEDRKSSMKHGLGPPLNLSRVDIEVSSPSVQGSPTGGGGAPTARLASNAGRPLNLATTAGVRNPRSASSIGTGPLPQLQNQASKQAMARTKAVSGSNMASATTPTVPQYVERVPLPGTVGKNPGPGLPFHGQGAPSSQSLKQSQAGMGKVGPRNPIGPGVPTVTGASSQAVLATAMAKNQGQQARNQQGTPTVGTPPRMPPSGSAPVLSSGTLSLSSSHSPSVPKSTGTPVSKSPSNGKGTVPIAKSGAVSAKRSPVSAPTLSSVMAPGQNMSAKAPLQQKSQGQLPLPQFSQQQTTAPAQQPQLGSKHQIYHQQQPQQGNQYKQSFPPQQQYRPQLFLQQHHPQYLQHSSLQQQGLPQQTQQPSPHYFQQNTHHSPNQHVHTHPHLRHEQHHTHLQQQLQPVPSSSSATANSGLSLSPPSLTLGTSSDGTGQFQGAGSRINPPQPKAPSSSGVQLSGGGMQKNNMTVHASSALGSGQQVSSPKSGSSHYLQLAPVLGVKSIEQKTLPDGINQEDMSGIRILPASAPAQPPLITNPTSS